MLTIVQKTDTEIRDQVIRELHWDCRTEASPIRVSVLEGAVTLGGTVKYYAVKRAAEEAAARIAGVTSVNDRIEVKIPHDEYRGDCEIADAVRNAYAWNVLVPAEQISVLVEGGTVILDGTVSCLSQREEAERAVVNLLGVRGIANNIAVESQPMKSEEVCADICDTLQRQSVANKSQVQVALEGGAVRLSGIVPTSIHRSAVVSAAKFAHGVRRVVDDLQVAVVA
jgi:osmotically-inducible protein OsmY